MSQHQWKGVSCPYYILGGADCWCLKDRRPVDPPPIIQLRAWDSKLKRYVLIWMISVRLTSGSDAYLQNPYFFVCATLAGQSSDESNENVQQTRSLMTGTTVSSLYRLKDLDNIGKLNTL